MPLPIPASDVPWLKARCELFWNGPIDKNTLWEFAVSCYDKGRDWERHLYGDGHQGWELAAVEKAVILQALIEVKGNKTRAAALLGISKSSLFRKLKAMDNGTGQFKEEHEDVERRDGNAL